MTEYVDRIFQEVQRAVTAGLDLETTGRAKQAAVEAILKQAEALRDADYPPKKFAEIARAIAHTTKMVDELTRLEEFAKGKPDSRPDLGGEWLKALTDEQLEQVSRWLEDNERAEAEAEASGGHGRVLGA